MGVVENMPIEEHV